MAGEAGLVRAAWPPLEEEAHFMKAMRMGVPPRGPLLSFQGAEPTALKDIVQEW